MAFNWLVLVASVLPAGVPPLMDSASWTAL
jgi:hypothetical protein